QPQCLLGAEQSKVARVVWRLHHHLVNAAPPHCTEQLSVILAGSRGARIECRIPVGKCSDAPPLWLFWIGFGVDGLGRGRFLTDAEGAARVVRGAGAHAWHPGKSSRAISSPNWVGYPVASDNVETQRGDVHGAFGLAAMKPRGYWQFWMRENAAFKALWS